MDTYSQLDNYDGRPCAVTIGVFDGVHTGHVDLLNNLVRCARESNLLSVVVTFEDHPRIVLSKGNDRVGLLTTAEERNELLAKTGVDRLVVLPFTREFSDLTAQRFIADYLRDKIGARLLLMGYNHRFGCDLLSPEEYVKVAEAEGLKAVRADVFVLADGTKVSSSDARRALENGDVRLATSLLGRQYSIRGTVVHGDGIGRTISFPTANVESDDENKLVPKDGVYSGTCRLYGKEDYRAVINIGLRPTVGGRDKRIEAHLIDYADDRNEAGLYGESVELSFDSRIRDEQSFKDTKELAEQISRDISVARGGEI